MTQTGNAITPCNAGSCSRFVAVTRRLVERRVRAVRGCPRAHEVVGGQFDWCSTGESESGERNRPGRTTPRIPCRTVYAIVDRTRANPTVNRPGKTPLSMAAGAATTNATHPLQQSSLLSMLIPRTPGSIFGRRKGRITAAETAGTPPVCEV